MYGNFPATSNPVSKPQPSEPVEVQIKPLNGWTAFSRVARLPLLPAFWMPVLWTTALAWWMHIPLDRWLLGLLLLLSTMLGLALNLLTTYYDYRQVRNSDLDFDSSSPANFSTEAILDGCRCLLDGWVRPGSVRSLAYVALLIAVLTVAWLGFLGGWPLWFFGGTSIVLLLIFLYPRLRYGRRWWIVDDFGLLFAMGILPALSAFYAQSETLTREALVTALTPAMLLWLAYQAYGLYGWRRDWKLRKRTSVVVLGPRRSLDLATLLGLLAFSATILMVALNEIPVWTLLVLGALPTFLRAFARGHHRTFSRSDAIQTIQLSSAAATLVGLLAIVAFWLAG